MRGLSRTQVNLEDFNGAMNDVTKAIEIKPNAAEDYFKRGLIKVAADDREGGAADLQKASELYVQQGRTDSHKNVIAIMKQLGL
jgi:serine/threonine-protein kinase